MDCVAYSLTKETNQKLLKIGKNIIINDKFFMIDNFHLTVYVDNNILNCTEFVNELGKSKNKFKRLIPKKWIVLQGKNTDFEYLALEVVIPDRVINNVDSLRKKNMKEGYFKLNTHISVVKANKGTFTKKLVKELNDNIDKIKNLKIDKILYFDDNHSIIKRISIK